MFIDIADYEEDKRIEMIGNAVMSSIKPGVKVAVCTDLEGPDGFSKADRYIRKLTSRFPAIRVIDKFKGPTPGAVTIRVTKAAGG